MAISEQPPQYPRAPNIRGEERLALVEDLALKKPHAELAEKYGKSVPAINQFSQRNAPEIATRRQVLLAQVDAEAAHLWISDKVTRRAWRQKMIEDMEVALADPDLDWRQRSRYNRDIAMLLHQGYADFGGLPNGVGCGFCGGFPHVPGLVGFGGIVFTGDGLRIDPPLGIPRMSCSSSKTAGSP
jgi:hypothetical protein